MTSKEISELNVWIYINVFGWLHSAEKEYPNRRGFSRDGQFVCAADMPDYCEDPAASRELEKAICGRVSTILIQHLNKGHHLVKQNACKEWCVNSTGVTAEAETLEMALAIFAKQIFKS